MDHLSTPAAIQYSSRWPVKPGAGHCRLARPRAYFPQQEQQGETAMKIASLAALALVLAPPVTGAQLVCLPNDHWGQILVGYMRLFSVTPTGGNQTVRINLGLPYITDASAVKLVTAEQTCKKARDAYIANASATATVRPAGPVYVIVIGDKYAVIDPVYRYSTIDTMTIQILDSKFKLLHFFG